MSNRPATLRDLRRQAARGACVDIESSPFHFGLHPQLFRRLRGSPYWVTVTVPEDVVPTRTCFDSRRVTPAELDRLISILGPHWSGSSDELHRVMCESRPKETDEVASVSAQPGDGALHGGDGNSGECAAPAQTGAAEPREGGDNALACDEQADMTGNASPDPGRGAGQDGAIGAEPPDSVAGARSKAGDNTVTTGEHAEVPGSMPSADAEAGSEFPELTNLPDQQAPTAEPSDELESDSPVGAGDGRSEEGAGEENDAAAEELDGGTVTSTSTPSPRNQWGGTFSDEEVAELRSAAERRSAQEVARALRKLIRAMELGGFDQTPRLSGARLVTELVSKRSNLARARRQEGDIPLVVLCCDVSGSCSAVCTDTLAACIAIAAELPNVLVIQHSNGFACNRDNVTITDVVREHDRQVGLLIAFGDWDAGDHYRALCESGADLVWLDSYCAKHGVKSASRNLRVGAADWSRQPLSWWQGVNSAATAAIALRQAARSTQP